MVHTISEQLIVVLFLCCLHVDNSTGQCQSSIFKSLYIQAVTAISHVPVFMTYVLNLDSF